MAGSTTGIDFDPYARPIAGNAATGDLDATFAPVEDDRVLIWDAVKAVTTPQGNLFWAPTATLSIPDELLSCTTAEDRAGLAGRVEALFETEQRFDLTCTVGYDAAQEQLQARLNITTQGTRKRYAATITADGEFTIEQVG